jgi:hypothetical protein
MLSDFAVVLGLQQISGVHLPARTWAVVLVQDMPESK